MLLTFLSRVMSTLLTTLLFVTIVGFTANQTILNTGYVEKRLESQQAYERLSTAISNEISKNAETPLSQPELQAKLKQILASQVLKEKIDTTLKQLKDYYQHDGPVPTLDISDLIAQAQQAGLDINDEKFEKPIKLTGLEKTKQVSDSARLASIGALVFMALLLIGVLAIALKRRDFRPLANITFSLGLMLTITGTALLFVPSAFSKAYKFNPSTNPFGSLASDLANATTRDFGLRLLIPGAVILLAGIVWKILIRKAGKPRSLAYAKADKPTILNDIPERPAKPVSVEDAPTTPTSPKNDIPGAPPAPRPANKSRKIQL
jgi:hypothetical protein